MATCKDCFYVSVCLRQYGKNLYIWQADNGCKNFKDKSRYIELPCKVGDTVYFVYEEYDEEGVNRCVFDCKVEQLGVDSKSVWFQLKLPLGIKLSGYFRDNKIGKTVFLTEEEAKKALKERENK